MGLHVMSMPLKIEIVDAIEPDHMLDHELRFTTQYGLKQSSTVVVVLTYNELLDLYVKAGARL